MSTLIASRLSISGRRCCVALSRKSQQSQSQTSRKIVNFKSGYRIAPEMDFGHFKQTRPLPRHLSGYISSQEDDYLKCWNCQEDFSHCVHSMVRILILRCSVSSALLQLQYAFCSRIISAIQQWRLNILSKIA